MRSKSDFPRGIDWDRVHRVIDRLAGKRASEREHRKQMERAGCFGPEFWDNYLEERGKDDVVRAILRIVSREAERLGLKGKVIVNIDVVDEKGGMRPAYDQWGTLDVQQKAEFVRKEFQIAGRAKRKALKYYRRGLEEHGEEFQLLLGFTPDEDLGPGMDEDDGDDDD